MCLSLEVDVIKSEDTLSDAREDQNGPAEGADFSTVCLKSLLLLSAIKLCFAVDVCLINRR